MLIRGRRLESDEDAGDKRSHQAAVFMLSKFRDSSYDSGAQRIFQLFADNHRVGWDRALLFNNPSRGDHFIVELLRNIPGRYCCLDLSLLQSLPALSVAAPEQDLFEKSLGVGFLSLRRLNEVQFREPAHRRNISGSRDRARETDILAL